MGSARETPYYIHCHSRRSLYKSFEPLGLTGWRREMKGRMRNNPTEKDNYGRPWFVVFRMHVSSPTSLPSTSGGQHSCGTCGCVELDSCSTRGSVAGEWSIGLTGLTCSWARKHASWGLNVACAESEVSP